MPFLGQYEKRNLEFPSTLTSNNNISKYVSSYENNGSIFNAGPTNALRLTQFIGRINPFLSLVKEKTNILPSLNSIRSMRENGDSNIEFLPEFFSFPEMFINLNHYPQFKDFDVKPNYATVYEFVYLNRKNLEECKDLNKWIDLMFGVNQRNIEKYNVFVPEIYHDVWSKNSGCSKEKKKDIQNLLGSVGSLPPQIFMNPFPERKVTESKLSYKVLNFTLKNRIKFGYFLNSAKSPTLIIMDIKNKMRKLKIKNQTQKSYKINIPKSSSYVFCPRKSLLYVTKENSDKIYEISGKEKEFQISINEADFLSFFGNYFVTATKNGEIRFWFDKEFDTIFSKFNFYYCPISVLTVSSSLGIIVFGHNDANISIFSIHKFRFVNKIKLSSAPIKIIVTKSMAFIVVNCYRRLFLLTINGFLIKEHEIDFEIDQWCSFSNNGVDLVCCTDMVGKMFLFEAFYPEKIHCYMSCKARCVSVAAKERKIDLVLCNGEVYVFNV